MLRRVLTYLGLRAAPSPIRQYAMSASVFGAVPVLAFVAWKNRDTIKATYQKLTHRGESLRGATGSLSSGSRSTSTPYSASALS